MDNLRRVDQNVLKWFGHRTKMSDVRLIKTVSTALAGANIGKGDHTVDGVNK